MHTPTASTAPFTLAFWKEGRTHEQRAGYRGTAAEFGEIVLTAPLPRKYTPDGVVSEVRGPSVPTAVFETRGIHTEAADLPTLYRSVLRVGDAMVHLRRNRFGLTRRARALHFRYGGDHYRLRAVNRKQFVLVRRADDEDPGALGRCARGPGKVHPALRGEPGLTGGGRAATAPRRVASATRRAGRRPPSAGPRSSRRRPCRGSGPAPAAA
ncbi:hypothetical protein ACIOFY_10820 [Streptomyces anulatus]